MENACAESGNLKAYDKMELIMNDLIKDDLLLLMADVLYEEEERWEQYNQAGEALLCIRKEMENLEIEIDGLDKGNQQDLAKASIEEMKKQEKDLFEEFTILLSRYEEGLDERRAAIDAGSFVNSEMEKLELVSKQQAALLESRQQLFGPIGNLISECRSLIVTIKDKTHQCMFPPVDEDETPEDDYIELLPDYNSTYISEIFDFESEKQIDSFTVRHPEGSKFIKHLSIDMTKVDAPSTFSLSFTLKKAHMGMELNVNNSLGDNLWKATVTTEGILNTENMSYEGGDFVVVELQFPETKQTEDVEIKLNLNKK